MASIRNVGSTWCWLVLVTGCAPGSTESNPAVSAGLRFSNPVLVTDEGEQDALVFVADANDDKWLDVLTWGEGAPYLNVASPEEGLNVPVKLAGLPAGPVRQAAWLDLTGDRCADLLVLDADGKLRRFHSEAIDEYSEHPLKFPELEAVTAFTTLDLDRDGRLDYLLLGTPGEGAAEMGTTHVYLLLGEEGNRFTLAEDLVLAHSSAGGGQTTSFLQPLDLNGDGTWEIVVGAPRVGVGVLVQMERASVDAGLSAPTDAGSDAEGSAVEGNHAEGDAAAAAPVPSGPELLSFSLISASENEDTSSAVFIDANADGDVEWFRFSPEDDVEVRVLGSSGAFEPEDQAKGLGVGQLGCVEDFDNDGKLDVLAVGERLVLTLGTSQLGKFSEGLQLEPGSELPVSSLVCVDVDNDGDLDLVTAGRKGTGLYFNRLEPLQSESANYFDFRFVGADDNTPAVGTRVSLTVGKQVRQRDFLISGQAHLPNSPSLHFGLGSETALDKVEVVWPTSKALDDSDWTANDTVTIIQSE